MTPEKSSVVREFFLPLAGYASILAFFFAVYWMSAGPQARGRLSESLGYPKGRAAAQMFMVGKSGRERGLGARQSCPKDDSADGLLCAEGYFYSEYSEVLEKKKAALRAEAVSLRVADADEPIKAVALGMAVAQAGVPPAEIRLPRGRFQKYFYDGYGAGLQFLWGRAEQKIVDACAGTGFRVYCEFGAGRASYYLGYAHRGKARGRKAREHPEYLLGQRFAAVMTGDFAPDAPSAIESLALQWRGKNLSAEAYRCSTRPDRHIIDCLPAEGAPGRGGAR